MTTTPSNFLQRNRRAILITLGVLFLCWLAREPLETFALWVVDREAVAEYFRSYGHWGMIAYLALLILQVIVALIPGQALVFAAGYVFGFVPTLLITIPTAVLSSQLAFFLARRYGKPIAYRLASQKAVDRWEKMARHQGILFYFLAFNLPIFPSDAMCYVAGLGTISGSRFLVANFLGRLVSTIFTVAIAAYGFNLPGWFWVVIVIVFLLLYFGWAWYARENDLKIEAEN